MGGVGSQGAELSEPQLSSADPVGGLEQDGPLEMSHLEQGVWTL